MSIEILDLKMQVFCPDQNPRRKRKQKLRVFYAAEPGLENRREARCAAPFTRNIELEPKLVELMLVELIKLKNALSLMVWRWWCIKTGTD